MGKGGGNTFPPDQFLYSPGPGQMCWGTGFCEEPTWGVTQTGEVYWWCHLNPHCNNITAMADIITSLTALGAAQSHSPHNWTYCFITQIITLVTTILLIARIIILLITQLTTHHTHHHSHHTLLLITHIITLIIPYYSSHTSSLSPYLNTYHTHHYSCYNWNLLLITLITTLLITELTPGLACHSLQRCNSTYYFLFMKLPLSLHNGTYSSLSSQQNVLITLSLHNGTYSPLSLHNGTYSSLSLHNRTFSSLSLFTMELTRHSLFTMERTHHSPSSQWHLLITLFILPRLGALSAAVWAVLLLLRLLPPGGRPLRSQQRYHVAQRVSRLSACTWVKQKYGFGAFLLQVRRRSFVIQLLWALCRKRHLTLVMMVWIQHAFSKVPVVSQEIRCTHIVSMKQGNWHSLCCSCQSRLEWGAFLKCDFHLPSQENNDRIIIWTWKTDGST